MNASPVPERHIARAQSALTAAMHPTWRAGRLPLLAVLTLLEPVARTVFSLAMVLGICAAIVFEFSAVGPRFPFLGMFGLSLGFGVALFVYYGLLSLLSR